jgi:hypothetical protein
MRGQEGTGPVRFTPTDLAELRRLLLEWVDTIKPLWEALRATSAANGAVATWLRSHTPDGTAIEDLDLPLGYATILGRAVQYTQAVGGVSAALKAVPLDDLLDFLKKPREENP